MTTILEACENRFANARVTAAAVIDNARDIVTGELFKIIDETIPNRPHYHKLDPDDRVFDVIVSGPRVYINVGTECSVDQLSLPITIFENDDPISAAAAYRVSLEEQLDREERQSKLALLKRLKDELGET